MFVRTMRARLRDGMADEFVAFWRSNIEPAAREQPGFLGSTVLIDRTDGSGMTTTVWETADAVSASGSNGFLAAQIAKLGPYIASPSERHDYEVLHESRSATPTLGSQQPAAAALR